MTFQATAILTWCVCVFTVANGSWMVFVGLPQEAYDIDGGRFEGDSIDT